MINVLSLKIKKTQKYRIGQILCFENWVQNKGSLSMLCIAPGVFIRRNTVITDESLDIDGNLPFLAIIEKKNIAGKGKKS